MFGKDGASSAIRKAALATCTETIQIGPFGSVLHKSDYIDGGVPLINPMHISNGKICPSSSFSVSLEKHSSLARYQLRAGDVIMGRRGEMGRCAVVAEQEAGFLCGTGSLYLRPRTDLVRPIYMQAFLSSRATVTELEKAAAGVTMANLNSKVLDALQIPLPPISEQIAFERGLHKRDVLRTSQVKQRSVAERLFRSLQCRAFRGEL
jgi:type I restriction enzyme S subunit